MTVTNAARADTVAVALATFAIATGTADEDPETIASDMIANILHWVATQPRPVAATGGDRDGLTSALVAGRNGLTGFLCEHYAKDGDDIGPEMGLGGSCYGLLRDGPNITRAIFVTFAGNIDPTVKVLDYVDEPE